MLKVGHRGAAGYALENSASSFETALELGVDMIEFDVRRCKSGELVVIHDATVDRVTKGQGAVADLTLKEIKALISRHYSKKILTLHEAIMLINQRAIADIELKEADTAADVAALLSTLIKNGWNPTSFLVSSFNHYELQIFKQLCPEVPIMPLLGGIPLGFAQCVMALQPTFLGLYHEFINQAFVDDAHAKGIKVLVYTPNTTQEINAIKALGVDGIISDFPDKI